MGNHDRLRYSREEEFGLFIEVLKNLINENRPGGTSIYQIPNLDIYS
jgi:hypothetical protein